MQEQQRTSENRNGNDDGERQDEARFEDREHHERALDVDHRAEHEEGQQGARRERSGEGGRYESIRCGAQGKQVGEAHHEDV